MTTNKHKTGGVSRARATRPGWCPSAFVLEGFMKQKVIVVVHACSAQRGKQEAPLIPRRLISFVWIVKRASTQPLWAKHSAQIARHSKCATRRDVQRARGVACCKNPRQPALPVNQSQQRDRRARAAPYQSVRSIQFRFTRCFQTERRQCITSFVSSFRNIKIERHCRPLKGGGAEGRRDAQLRNNHVGDFVGE